MSTPHLNPRDKGFFNTFFAIAHFSYPLMIWMQPIQLEPARYLPATPLVTLAGHRWTVSCLRLGTLLWQTCNYHSQFWWALGSDMNTTLCNKDIEWWEYHYMQLRHWVMGIPLYAAKWPGKYEYQSPRQKPKFYLNLCNAITATSTNQ